MRLRRGAGEKYRIVMIVKAILAILIAHPNVPLFTGHTPYIVFPQKSPILNRSNIT